MGPRWARDRINWENKWLIYNGLCFIRESVRRILDVVKNIISDSPFIAMFSFFNRSRSDSPVQEPVRVENPTQAKVQPVAPQTRQVPVGTLPIQLDPRYIRESLPEVDFGYVRRRGLDRSLWVRPTDSIQPDF